MKEFPRAVGFLAETQTGWRLSIDGVGYNGATVSETFRMAERNGALRPSSERNVALQWKNAALDLHEALSQVSYGLNSAAPLVPESAQIAKKASERFEAENPPEDEAGWSRVQL